MTKITLFSDNNKINKIEVSEHSLYAEEGQDIVCAGISILTVSLMNGLTEIVGIELLNHVVKEGYVSFEIPQIDNRDKNIQIKALLDTYKLGVLETEKYYRDFLTVIEK